MPGNETALTSPLAASVWVAEISAEAGDNRFYGSV
jgi:hypothetical protein